MTKPEIILVEPMMPVIEARLDADYLDLQGFSFDLKVIFTTLRAAVSGQGVRH